MAFGLAISLDKSLGCMQSEREREQHYVLVVYDNMLAMHIITAFFLYQLRERRCLVSQFSSV